MMAVPTNHRSCLASGKTRGKIRCSKTTPWRAAVLIIVHLVIAMHIVWWWFAGSALSPLEPSEAAEFSRHSIVNAGLIFFVAMILVTLVFGRFFCGWGCHMVALQDLARAGLLRIGIRPKPVRSRVLMWVPALAFLYMFVWPLIYRIWNPELHLGFQGFELTTENFWETFPGAGVALVTFAVCGFLTIYFLGAKGFCTYACPYGAIFGAVDRFAPGRIRVTDACEGCGHCTATCTSNVRVAEEVRDWGMVVNPGCMKCMDCVSVCPKDALYYGFGKPRINATSRQVPAQRRPRISVWEEVLLGLFFVAAFLTFHSLYGLVPLLLSLGIAAIVAVVSLNLVHLVTEKNVAIQNMVLKRAGRVRPAGWIFILALVAFLPLWVHSAMIQYHGWRADAAYRQLQDLRVGWFAMEKQLLDARTLGIVRTLEMHARSSVERGLLYDYRRAMQLGWARLMRGDESGYARQLEAALADAPDDATLHLQAGHWRLARTDYALAAEHYSEALALNPSGVAAALSNYGEWMATRGKVRAADTIFNVAASTVPGDAGLQYNYGVFLATEGRTEESQRYFRSAVELDPGLLEARENLASVLCQLNRMHECIEQYRISAEQSPEDPDTRARLAKAYFRIGNRTAAEVEIRRAIALARNETERRQLYRLLRSFQAALPGVPEQR